MESIAIFELLYQCGSEGSNHLSTWSSGNVPEKLHLVKIKKTFIKYLKFCKFMCKVPYNTVLYNELNLGKG
jgi:hypothetical protein